EQRHAHTAQLLAQPVIIFRFERFLCEWVASVSVKSSRHADQLRLEFLHLTNCAAQNLALYRAWCVRGHRRIEQVIGKVSAAGNGIAVKLVDGQESFAWLVQEHRF